MDKNSFSYSFEGKVLWDEAISGSCCILQSCRTLSLSTTSAPYSISPVYLPAWCAAFHPHAGQMFLKLHFWEFSFKSPVITMDLLPSQVTVNAPWYCMLSRSSTFRSKLLCTPFTYPPDVVIRTIGQSTIHAHHMKYKFIPFCGSLLQRSSHEFRRWYSMEHPERSPYVVASWWWWSAVPQVAAKWVV